MEEIWNIRIWFLLDNEDFKDILIYFIINYKLLEIVFLGGGIKYYFRNFFIISKIMIDVCNDYF